MNATEFLSSLKTSHVLGLEDLNYASVFDHQLGEGEGETEVVAEEEEIEDPMETET